MKMFIFLEFYNSLHQTPATVQSCRRKEEATVWNDQRCQSLMLRERSNITERYLEGPVSCNSRKLDAENSSTQDEATGSVRRADACCQDVAGRYLARLREPETTTKGKETSVPRQRRFWGLVRQPFQLIYSRDQWVNGGRIRLVVEWSFA